MPRIQTEPTQEKLVQGSWSDHLSDQMMEEIFEAMETKDVKSFRKALENMVMDMFDWEGTDASDALE